MNPQPNQFSRWKYIIIITSVLLSLIYTLPNFYGEAPALQIMSIKSGEADREIGGGWGKLSSENYVQALSSWTLFKSYLDKHFGELTF